MIKFIIEEIVCVFLQTALFIPFFVDWIHDCKKFGKENLAVSLKERFKAWILVFPFWLFPILAEFWKRKGA